MNKAKSTSELANQLGETALHQLILLCDENPDNWEIVTKVWIYLKIMGKAKDVAMTALARHHEVDGVKKTLNLLPLHLACSFKPPAVVVQLLISEAPETVTKSDENGDTPLHHACMNGASQTVIALLFKVYLVAREIQGSLDRTPLHHYLVYHGNKDSMISPGIVSILCSREVVTKEDAKEKTPFMLFIDHAKSVDKYMKSKGHHHESTGRDIDFQELCDNCIDVLKELMNFRPPGTLKFIRQMNNLPPWLFREALDHIHAQRILNKAISHPFSSAVLTLDLYVHILLILAFTSASTTKTFKSKSEEAEGRDSLTDEGWEEPALLGGVVYLLVRELAQIMAFLSLNMLPLWLCDLWNWLDISILILLFFSLSHLMDTTYSWIVVDDGLNDDGIRNLIMITAGVVWFMMFSPLKGTYLSFSVFVSGLIHVICILVPFVVTSGIILGAFAVMYNINSVGSEECIIDEGAQGGFINLTFCSLRSSLLKIYVMFVNGEVDEEEFTSSKSAMWLSIIFAFLVMILLLNVLIAIVTDSYNDVKKCGRAFFWSHRYNIVLEFTAIWNILFCPRRNRQRTANTPQTDVESELLYILTVGWLTPLLDDAMDDSTSGTGSQLWQRLVDSFTDTQRWNQCLAKRECCCSIICLPLILLIKAILMLVFFPLSKILIGAFLAIWLVVGLLTLGVLWPPQVREWIFCPGVIRLNFDDSDYKLRREVKQVKEELYRVNEEMGGMKQELASELKEELDNAVRKMAVLVAAAAKKQTDQKNE